MVRFSLFLTLLAFVSCGASYHKQHTTVIAIQPIGSINLSEVNAVKAGLDSIYGMQVIVLPTLKPPASAFINIKTPRYRADKLIAWLKQQLPDSADYIIGLTALDISTTKTDDWGRTLEPKSRYEDFGIFGLGYCPGKSCIVSTFRLGNKPDLMRSRLAKIAVHEVGHNLGLPHCKTRNCVMADAVERISTIDEEGLSLCKQCRTKAGF